MLNFTQHLQKIGEYGDVIKINYPIASIVGLPKVKMNELILFETGEKGQVIGLSDEQVSVMLFSPPGLKIGTKATRTDSHFTVPVGPELFGHVIDPFGVPMSRVDTFTPPAETRPIDSVPSGISFRQKISDPLITGTAVVDIVIPLGKGQKQLILGDRKTGKSTFVRSTINNQIHEGAVAIYAAIGKRKSDIKHIEEFMKNDEARKQNMVVIATTAFDSPGLIYLTPFAAMTIAEYFRDQGREVFLILDDLLNHAKFYREFSLLAESFPGRDSYPGDIFNVHARLLERAGNFKHEKKGAVSISCFPIAETQEADLTSYIVSNLMSITDGHILFDSNVFAQGRRPAINIPISVTRVGRQTQTKVTKDINRELNSLLSIYDKAESFSHFGPELSDSVKSIFSIGSRVYHFFNQPEGLVVPREVYLVLFSLIWLNILNTEEEIDKARTNLLASSKKPENLLLLKTLLEADSFNGLLKNIRDNKDTVAKLWNSAPN